MTPLEDELASIVPISWSGEHALRVVHLLNAAARAIWAVHAEDMAFAIANDHHHAFDDLDLLLPHHDDPPDLPDDPFDDLPF